MKGAVADDAHVGFGDAERGGDAGGGFVVIEGHDDDGAVALLEVLEAVGELVVVEAGGGRSGEREGRGELLEETVLAAGVAADIEDGHTAGAEDEGGEFGGFAETAEAEGFEDGEEDVLGEVVGGSVVAQVAEAVEPDARGHAAE